jgi:hypothetical protein
MLVASEGKRYDFVPGEFQCLPTGCSNFDGTGRITVYTDTLHLRGNKAAVNPG